MHNFSRFCCVFALVLLFLSASGAVAQQAQVNLQVFQQSASSSFLGETSTFTTFDVPEGKRLVIEYVSAEVGLLSPGVEPKFLRVCTAFGPPPGDVCHSIPFTQHSGGVWVAGQQVRLYADSPNEVYFAVGVSGGSSGGLQAKVSGYLVDRP